MFGQPSGWDNDAEKDSNDDDDNDDDDNDVNEEWDLDYHKADATSQQEWEMRNAPRFRIRCTCENCTAAAFL